MRLPTRNGSKRSFYELRRTRELFVVLVIVVGILANYYTILNERLTKREGGREMGRASLDAYLTDANRQRACNLFSLFL